MAGRPISALGELVCPPLTYPWRPDEQPPGLELLARVLAGLRRLDAR